MTYGKRNQVQHPKRGDKKTGALGGFSRALSVFKHTSGTSDDASSSDPLCVETSYTRSQQSSIELWRYMFNSAVAQATIENMRRRVI